MAAVYAPKLGVDTLAKTMCIASAGTLANLGVSSSYLSALSQVTPPPATTNKLVIELDVDIVVLISKEIQDKNLSLICDKGDGKALSMSLIKLLCWYNALRKSVEVICFDIESAGNTSKDAAQGINHSLKC